MSALEWLQLAGIAFTSGCLTVTVLQLHGARLAEVTR